MADIKLQTKQSLFFFFSKTLSLLLYFNSRINFPENDSSEWNQKKKETKKIQWSEI